VSPTKHAALRCVVYDRVSEADPESQAAHLERCRDLAKARGWKVVAEHVDTASGFSKEPSTVALAVRPAAHRDAARPLPAHRARLHVRGCDRSPDGTSTSPEADPPVVDVSDHGVTIIRPHRRSKR
jgi:hypothetical protein